MNGNVGIGAPASSNFRVYVDGAINASGYCNLLVNSVNVDSSNLAPSVSAVKYMHVSVSNALWPIAKNVFVSGSNVGVGKSNPNYKLDVGGIVNASAIYINNIPIELSGLVSGSNSGGSGISTSLSKIVNNIYVGNTSSSNVGIGTSNPSSNFKLDVNGSINANGTINANALTLQGSNYDLKTMSNITYKLNSNIIFNGSNIGIGKSNAGYKLDVGGSINASAVYVNGAPVSADDKRWVSPTSNMLTTSNIVGIGVSNPMYTLHVGGDMMVNSNVLAKSISFQGVRIKKNLTGSSTNFTNVIGAGWETRPYDVYTRCNVTVAGNIVTGNIQSTTFQSSNIQSSCVTSTIVRSQGVRIMKSVNMATFSNTFDQSNSLNLNLGAPPVGWFSSNNSIYTDCNVGVNGDLYANSVNFRGVRIKKNPSGGTTNISQFDSRWQTFSNSMYTQCNVAIDAVMSSKQVRSQGVRIMKHVVFEVPPVIGGGSNNNVNLGIGSGNIEGWFSSPGLIQTNCNVKVNGDLYIESNVAAKSISFQGVRIKRNLAGGATNFTESLGLGWRTKPNAVVTNCNVELEADLITKAIKFQGVRIMKNLTGGQTNFSKILGVGWISESNNVYTHCNVEINGDLAAKHISFQGVRIKKNVDGIDANFSHGSWGTAGWIGQSNSMYTDCNVELNGDVSAKSIKFQGVRIMKNTNGGEMNISRIVGVGWQAESNNVYTHCNVEIKGDLAAKQISFQGVRIKRNVDGLQTNFTQGSWGTAGWYGSLNEMYTDCNVRLNADLAARSIKFQGVRIMKNIDGGNANFTSVTNTDFKWITANNSMFTSYNVGIGTSNPLYKLDVAGHIRTTGIIYSVSDSNIKTDIKIIDNALEKLCNVSGYTFKVNDNIQAGVLAQEIEKVLPEVVSVCDVTGLKSVSYGNIVGLLIESIKELKTKYENDIAELKEIIKTKLI
jgi:hypothetical protein